MSEIKLDILAFGAHPDDVELACSGTLLRHKELGYSIGVVDLTKGELGTRGNAVLRAQESALASALLGLAVRDNLGFRDGFFTVDEAHKLAVVKAIRRYRPEVVLCNAPLDRHPDHGRAGSLVAEACFYSGLVKIETKDEGEWQAAWRPKAVYHFVQDVYLKPDFVVDITEQMSAKMEAIKVYSSQFFNPDSEEPQTPISSESFMQFIVARAREMGRPAGFEFAEGFIAGRVPGVKNLFGFS